AQASSWNGLDVLDLGCGKGRFSRHFQDWGARVVGLDGSRAMLDGARGLDTIQGAASQLPLAAARFDVVVAVETFQHFSRPGVVLREIARVLRPGGQLLIVDRNATALDVRRPWLPATGVKWLDERRGLWMYPAGGPFRERWF